MSENKNLLWVNCVRGICVLAVFLIHSESYYDYIIPNVAVFIQPFYVNAFFFISGFLLFRKQFSSSSFSMPTRDYFKSIGKEYLKNILYRLVIPSVVFSIIEFLPNTILRNKEFSFFAFLGKTLGGCTYWFVSALVVAELLVLLLFVFFRRKLWVYIIVASVFAIWGYYLSNNQFYIWSLFPAFPWHYKQGFEALFFLVCGGVYWEYEEIVDKYLRKKEITIAMLVCYIIVLSLWPYNIKVLISTNELNIIGVLFSVFATLLLVSLCKVIQKAPILDYLGRNSLVFYFFSGALPVCGSIIIHHIFPKESLIGLFCVYVFSILVSSVISYFINRFMPWLLDIRKARMNTIVE